MTNWQECKLISELPEVDEALRLFAEGETTEDQAVAIVQAILQAAQQPAGDVVMDAERYRWLKSQPVEVPAEGPDLTVWDGNGSGYALRGDAADAAIDSARKAGGEV